MSYTVFPSSTRGSPAFGFAMSGREELSVNRSIISSITSGPNEQFIPVASTPSPSSIAVIAAGSAPVISLPLLSYTFVTNIGRDEFSFAAMTAAFVSRQSFIVSIIMRSARSAAARTFDAKIETASSNERSPSGSSIRPVGPMSSAIYASLPPTAFSAQSSAAEISSA